MYTGKHTKNLSKLNGNFVESLLGYYSWFFAKQNTKCMMKEGIVIYMPFPHATSKICIIPCEETIFSNGISTEKLPIEGAHVTFQLLH
jgi:hypothetical protein